MVQEETYKIERRIRFLNALYCAGFFLIFIANSSSTSRNPNAIAVIINSIMIPEYESSRTVPTSLRLQPPSVGVPDEVGVVGAGYVVGVLSGAFPGGRSF